MKTLIIIGIGCLVAGLYLFIFSAFSLGSKFDEHMEKLEERQEK